MTVLAASGLAKKYCPSARRAMAYGIADVARELVPFAPPSTGLRPGEFWALDDVSFTLEPGEALGIVGRNGAGKSTLLRLLAGIIRPDRGEIRLRGRVGAVLDLGAGLNPSLSGRENILLGAAVQGLGARAARAFVDPVIDFAELDPVFLDAPVQNYSTGMRARLAYAIRACLEQDLLLVDEALAVGDHAFQRKCVSHMLSYLDGGGALLLVSHNAQHIQAVCGRGLLLEHGRVVFEGNAVDTISQKLDRTPVNARPGLDRSGPVAPGFRILEIGCAGDDNGPLRTGAPAHVRVRYRSDEPREVRWSFSVMTDDRWVLVTGDTSPEPQRIAAGEGELGCRLPALSLMPGTFWMHASVADARTGVRLSDGALSPPVALRVEADPDPWINLRRQFGQLVTTQVEWDRP
jgi:lipopolysaccharide transport system ATP-binding protein